MPPRPAGLTPLGALGTGQKRQKVTVGAAGAGAAAADGAAKAAAAGKTKTPLNPAGAAKAPPPDTRAGLADRWVRTGRRAPTARVS